MVAVMRRYPTIMGPNGIFDIFLITPRPKMDPRDLRSHILEGILAAVDRAHADMAQSVGQRPLPYFSWSSQATTVVTFVGAVVPRYPLWWQCNTRLPNGMHSLLKLCTPSYKWAPHQHNYWKILGTFSHHSLLWLLTRMRQMLLGFNVPTMSHNFTSSSC